jgi:hypothetical protein
MINTILLNFYIKKIKIKKKKKKKGVKESTFGTIGVKA